MSNLYNQKQYALLYKNMTGRNLHIKIDLLNDKDVKVDSFEGITTSGSINLDGNSTYRRTGSIATILENNLLPKPENKIWFNKRIKVYIGLKDFDDNIVWYDMGKFAVDKVSAKSSQTDKSLDINLLDYMAFLDGTLSGYLSHNTQLTAKSGVKVNEAIKSSVQHLPKVMIDRFEIEGLDAELPYDMEFNPNGSVNDIVKSLTDLYMSQEYFFDTNGTFRVQRIRDRSTDPITWNFSEDNMDLSIDYQNEINMSHVKNAIHVWGSSNDATGIQTYWVYRNRWSRNNYSDLSSLNDKQKGDICFVKSENKSYCYNGSGWSLLDFNVISQFNIESIGEKIWTHSDTKIFTEEQAKLRSEYELTNQSSFAETINFTTIPIYLLTPNSKIHIENPESGISGDYLITSISHGLSVDSVSNIKARKIYY